MRSVPDYVWKKVMENKTVYNVVRSRRRSIALIVRDDGSVEIRCPRSVTKHQIEEIVHSRLEWIKRQQLKIADRIDLPDLDSLSDHDLKEYRIRLQARIESFMHNYDGPKPAGFTIRRQKTRWGSCSSRKNINLNLKSLFLPEDLFEYLMEHELAHLVHMNHSTLFWQYLESSLPDARARQRRLKKYRLISQE